VIDSVNCEVIGFRAEGTITSSSTTISGPSVTARQTAIGTGNRSCVQSPPAIAPCFIYVSSSTNAPAFPHHDITFATDPDLETAVPAETTTTLKAVGSPVAIGKTPYALVEVKTPSDSTLRPEGLVQVYEGATLRGSSLLDANSKADIPLTGAPGLGNHTLHAVFTGNGSFDPSTSADTTLSIISANNISVGDATIVEGNAGTRSMVFPVVLSKLSPVPVTMTYTLAGTGANAATTGWGPSFDVYQVAKAATTKTLTFSTTQTVKYITVKVNGDTTPENDEVVELQLSNVNVASGYVLRKAAGTGVVIDDDTTPIGGTVLNIGASSVPEGDSGATRAMKFAITLSQPAPADITVFLHIESVTAVHGNKVNGDWGGGIMRKVVIRQGATNKALGIGAFANLRHDDDLTVNVVLDSAGGVTMGPHSEAIGTILSDE
jgi:hypothetical protein